MEMSPSMLSAPQSTRLRARTHELGAVSPLFPWPFIPLAFSLRCVMFTPSYRTHFQLAYFFLPQILTWDLFSPPALKESSRASCPLIPKISLQPLHSPATVAAEQLARVQEFSRQDGEWASTCKHRPATLSAVETWPSWPRASRVDRRKAQLTAKTNPGSFLALDPKWTPRTPTLCLCYPESGSHLLFHSHWENENTVLITPPVRGN